jgi:hypothetical protein
MTTDAQPLESHLAESQAPITVWGAFADPVLEDRYRRSRLRWDCAWVRWILAIALFPTLVFIASDYHLFGVSSGFWILAAVRLVMLIGLGSALVLVRWVTTPRQLDCLVFASVALITAASAYIETTRPSGYAGFAMMDVLALIGVLTVVPAPLRLQALLAGSMTVAAVLVLAARSAALDALTLLVVPAAYVVANSLGGLGAWNLHHWKRTQFAALLREQELRTELQQALAEIRTLRGIVPICAYCKKVRDDAGFWQQVESYVRDHTHAEFSHGICSACLEIHHPH